MNRATWIMMSLLGVLSAEAALKHRYTFNGTVADMIGDRDGKPSKNGTHTEEPQFVDDVPCDLRVYDHPLTAEEVAQLHSNPGSPKLGEEQVKKPKAAAYPWQNYTGPLKQNWFELHDGLKNSQYIFETTKKGTVAFVGGSITGMPRRKKVMADLKRRFPSTEFKFVLAGVGSTGTMYGSFRLDRDVIQKGKVDLLFEEAAVNDVSIGRTADQTVRGMEGIVRRARRANPDMDIVMMHFACLDKLENYENGKTPEVIQSFDKVAEHYGVPTLDITEEVPL